MQNEVYGVEFVSSYEEAIGESWLNANDKVNLFPGEAEAIGNAKYWENAQKTDPENGHYRVVRFVRNEVVYEQEAIELSKTVKAPTGNGGFEMITPEEASRRLFKQKDSLLRLMGKEQQ